MSATGVLMRQPATEKRHASSLEMDILLASKNTLWSKIVEQKSRGAGEHVWAQTIEAAPVLDATT